MNKHQGGCQRVPPPDTHLWYHLPPPILSLPQAFYAPAGRGLKRLHPPPYAFGQRHYGEEYMVQRFRHRDPSWNERIRWHASQQSQYTNACDEHGSLTTTHLTSSPHGALNHPHPQVESSSDSEEEVLQFELTEEFKEFLKISAEHRKKRDAEKNRQKLLDKRDSSHKHTKESRNMKTPSKGLEHSNVSSSTLKRRIDYGQQNAHIKQLEAWVNSRHDDSVDKNQPQLWPHMPLVL